MGKRGPRPRGQIKIKWSSEFSYALGLLTTDGCLSDDGRHISFVSKDREQIEHFSQALRLFNKTSRHVSGYNGSKAYRLQFGDVLFYRFLLGIGLTPAKSKTLGEVIIPDKYFFHFLRGVFDGDGYSYSYWDKRWRSSFMFYVGFVSASYKHILWLRGRLKNLLGLIGHITKTKDASCHQLKYAKLEATKIIRKMYPSKSVICLLRKRLKIEKMLGIVGKRL
ncbi:MAG: hypothetical protein HYT47_00515 [Candidatus Vogelbacteria bacterium]|nr:hypothetical protein [Candidatus Vogelbacteria bacterium]